jgi:uncharacterized protein (DUF2252 family)
VSAGRDLRNTVPLEAHAQVRRHPDGPDAVTLLEEQDRTRLPDLVPIRHGRMVASPFAFYRGAARVMARDLAGSPRTGLTVQMCGDAHLANFGMFGSPERRLMFDANDFDETLPGPFEYDVKRLVASLSVAGRQNGFTKKQRRAIVTASARRYRVAMSRFAGEGDLVIWYSRVDEEFFNRYVVPQLDGTQRKRLAKAMDKARNRDSLQVFGKLAEVSDGRLRIRPDPPLVVPLRDVLPAAEAMDLQAAFRTLLGEYRRSLQSDRRVLLERYSFVDMARKVVGVGSVGTRCWIVLLVGRDHDDPLFLQIKEAAPSVHAEYLGPSRYANQGQRVVAGQRVMQQSSDILLGWQRTGGLDGEVRDFYVRQLRDWKGSIAAEQLRPEGMSAYGEVCAWTLARAHARSGDRFAISGYLGDSEAFETALAEFAESYADRNEADHRALVDAVGAGRVSAVTGQ